MSLIHLRMFGYVVTILLHVSNGLYMWSFHQGPVMEDPEIRAFIGLQYRFITCWTFLFQIVYAIIGLICDWLTLKNNVNKKYKLPRFLSATRDTLFSAIIWPSSFQVATLFWPFYLSNPRLVYPVFIDRILTPLSNHIIHTAIVPIAVWEMVTRPQTRPQSEGRLVTILTAYSILYWIVLFYTYYEQGLWLYPMLKDIVGTIYLPLLILYNTILLVLHYKTQWYVISWLYNSKKNVSKKIK